MWNESVILIKKQEELDAAGDIVESAADIETEILCKEISVGQNEFYQAMATGFKPEVKLEIHSFEYTGEKKARYNGAIFDIIRTFTQKNGETLEITLGSDINGNSSK